MPLTRPVVLTGQRALVLGASGGIGSALARALAEHGAVITGVGRSRERLAALISTLPAGATPHTVAVCDFADSHAVAEQCDRLAQEDNDYDMVVMSSGELVTGSIRDSGAQDFDRAFAVNVRAPYALLRASLGGLIRRHGQIVMVSSSAALRPSPGAALYSSAHAALHSLVDSLRMEINPLQVRVLSIYPGRTATGIWKNRPIADDGDFRPELLLQPIDIARSVMAALQLPRTAEITDLHIRPFFKTY